MKKNIHIIKKDKEWIIKKAGNKKASASFDTQKKAIDYGRRIAKKDTVEILIHGKNGKIRERDTYGNDPFPPKG